MSDWIWLIMILAAWFAAQKWIFPRLGIRS